MVKQEENISSEMNQSAHKTDFPANTRAEGRFEMKQAEKSNQQNLFSQELPALKPNSLSSVFAEFHRISQNMRTFPQVFDHISGMINLMAYLSGQAIHHNLP